MLIDYFEDRGIEYWTSGKNVTQGWINIQCIFPGCDDNSNHLGIKIANRSGYYNCWICHAHGPLEVLIAELEGCSFREAMQLIREYDIWESDLEGSAGLNKKRLPPSPRCQVALPPLLKKWPRKYLSYLKKRRFDPQEVIRKYRLMPSQYFGRYGHRIIAPFFVSGEVVTFTAMRTRESQEPPYKDCSIENSIIPTNETVYNLDNIKGDKAALVEGITDVWRIGDGAVALGTKRISNGQILQLIEINVKEIMVLLDSDVSELDQRVLTGKLLSTFKFNEVNLGYLDSGDPDKMDAVDLLRVQKWLSS